MYLLGLLKVPQNMLQFHHYLLDNIITNLEYAVSDKNLETIIIY